MSFNPEKNPELMLFGNIEVPELKFKFNGLELPVSSFYKHLGVTLNSDAK